ncbi:hypothetical protein EZS27_029812 [termite gut metagenome]|uniref:Uncharacterized protein n=1 Tax=termite gut metagenome TaxID=433724 RepID=A0A5J4QHU8_9ZZZZ
MQIKRLGITLAVAFFLVATTFAASNKSEMQSGMVKLM